MRILGMLSVAVFILVMSMPATSSAEGNATGNGGGVICIAGKCQTLVEAGLRLAPDFDGVWIPEADHYSLVDEALKARLFLGPKIPKSIYFSVFGRADHFRRVEVVDQAKLNQIKNRYLSVATEAGFPIDPKTFKVVAFSSDDTVKPAMTYLLPDFFTLSLSAQVDILIHEGLYRGRPSNHLKYILQLETAMHTALSNSGASKCRWSTGKFLQACINQQILAYRLGMKSMSDLVGSLLHFSVVADQHSFIKVANFGDFKTEPGKAPRLILDPYKLLELGKREPRIPYMFSKTTHIEFELIEGRKSVCDYPSLFIDWSKSDEATLVSFAKSTGSDRCDVYRIAEDNLNLLLPE